LKTNATGIEMFHKILESAEPGDQLGILLRGLKREDLRRGMSVVKPGSAKLYNCFEAKVYLLNKEEGGRAKPLTSTLQPQIFSKTYDVPSKMIFPPGKVKIN
jgi:elongation factor Tu